MSDLRKADLRDRASATLVTSLISIMFICLCLGFALDVTKNAYLKNSFTSRAQQSAEVALKDIDSRGSIKASAAQKVVNEYGASGSATSSNKNDETKVFSGSCSKRTVVDWDSVKRERTMPYMVIRLNTKRAIGATDDVVYVSEGGSAPVLVKGTYTNAVKYTVLAADIHDASANFMLSMFGMGCQDFNQRVSAISFGSSGDTNDTK